MLRTLARLGIASLWVLVVSTTVAAQEPSPEDRQAAREAYARGQEAFRAGRLVEAEEAFQRAYDVIPNAVVLLSIAEVRERAGNPAGAVDALTAYLAARPDAPDASAIAARVARMRAIPATLTVVSSPTGAAVTVDGEPRGSTPVELSLGSGSHEIVLALSGYERSVSTVEARPGARQSVDVMLVEAARQPVRARVAAMPPPPSVPSEPAPPAPTPSVVPSIAPAPDAPSSGVERGTPVPAAVWVAGGVGAAGLVAGTIFGFMTLSEESSFEETPTTETADRGETYALLTDVSFGVAIAGGVTALVLIVTGDEDEPIPGETTALRVHPFVGPGLAGVGATIGF